MFFFLPCGPQVGTGRCFTQKASLLIKPPTLEIQDFSAKCETKLGACKLACLDCLYGSTDIKSELVTPITSLLVCLIISVSDS